MQNPNPGAPARSGADGGIERFIQAFHRYEAMADLFGTCRDAEGFAWWDLVRYNVQFALCVEKGIYGRRDGVPSAKVVRALSFLRQSLRLIRDAARIARLRGRGIGGLYVSGRRSVHLLGALQADTASGYGPGLLINGTGSAPEPHAAIAKQSVEFFVRLASKLMRLPPEVDRNAVRIDAEIRQHFESSVNVRAIIAYKYRQHLAHRRAWSFILSRLGSLRRIVFVNDDTLKTLVRMARVQGIETCEVQHGYMGGSHIGFSYPLLGSPLATLPDAVIVTRDTGDIIYPVPRISAGVDPGQEPGGETVRNIDVLIGASPTRAAETRGIVASLADRGLSLAVKLHPAQTEASTGLRTDFTPDQLAIHDGSGDFCALARRSKIYVPANPISTTAFEAVENGATLIIVDYDGQKLTATIDGIVSARVDSVDKLPKAVVSQLHRKLPQTATSHEDSQP